MREAFPEKTKLAIFWDAITSEQFEEAKRTTESLNLQLHSVKLGNSPYDFEAAFRTAADAQMLLVLSSFLFSSSRSRIAELAIKQRLPTMMSFKAYAEPSCPTVSIYLQFIAGLPRWSPRFCREQSPLISR
jgi:hypothetical protein